MPKKIIMSKSDFFKEHKNLIKLLSFGNSLIKEMNKQKKEVKKYKK